MDANQPPDHRDDSAAENFDDRTLSAGGPGGAAAGQIGPCRLLQIIGEGGMGEVWLARPQFPMKEFEVSCD